MECYWQLDWLVCIGQVIKESVKQDYNYCTQKQDSTCNNYSNHSDNNSVNNY